MATTAAAAAGPSARALPAVITAGIALRVAVYALPTLQRTLAARPELVTAVSSFQRVRESAFLFAHTGSPYAGDVFHQPPLVFALFYPLLARERLQYAGVCALFIAIDVLIALGFARLARRTLLLEEGVVPKDSANREIWLHKIPVSPLFSRQNLPPMAAFIYLFNPYSLASSGAMSTVSLTHLAVLYSLVFATEGAVVASMLCTAIGTYLSLYPVVLVIPIFLLLQLAKVPPSQSGRVQTKDAGAPAATAAPAPATLLMTCATSFLLALSVLLYMSYTLSNGWGFLAETYVWIAKYSDLTPNVGVFWYFFMEVFDRFIPYFLFVLHLHPCIYVYPLLLRLKHRPQAYATTLVGIFTLFQAYPSFGDFGFFLTAISLHPKTIMTIENRYVYALGLAVATCMLPVMWFLWLFPASGNANFFYNQTLVYQIFNSQVLTAFVGATMKRDKDLQKYRQRMAKAAAARIE